MKTFILILLVGSSLSAVIPEDQQATILSYENKNNGDGNYEFSFETSNGISRRENGRLINPGQSDEHIEVTGEYSYYDTEGKLVVVRYKADENGYHELPELVPMTIAAAPPALVASLLG